MKNKDIIPLTETMVVNYTLDLYYLCGAIRGLTPYTEISMQPGLCIVSGGFSTDRSEVVKCRETLGVNRKSFNAFLKNAPTEWQDNFVVMMPFDVWDLLLYSMRDLTTTERKTLTRVFIYLYYYAMRNYGTYARAREKIIEILHINKDTFTSAVKWLEDHALVERGDYLKKVTARSYTIPAILWTPECIADCERRDRFKGK